MRYHDPEWRPKPALKPTAHMFVGSKASWYEILDHLPQHDGYPWDSRG